MEKVSSDTERELPVAACESVDAAPTQLSLAVQRILAEGSAIRPDAAVGAFTSAF